MHNYDFMKLILMHVYAHSVHNFTFFWAGTRISLSR